MKLEYQYYWFIQIYNSWLPQSMFVKLKVPLHYNIKQSSLRINQRMTNIVLKFWLDNYLTIPAKMQEFFFIKIVFLFTIFTKYAHLLIGIFSKLLFFGYEYVITYGKSTCIRFKYYILLHLKCLRY